MTLWEPFDPSEPETPPNSPAGLCVAAAGTCAFRSVRRGPRQPPLQALAAHQRSVTRCEGDTGHMGEGHVSWETSSFCSEAFPLPANPPDPLFLLFQGLRFEVVPSRFKEKLDKAAFPTPYAYAIETAKQKALEVASRMHQARGPCFCFLPCSLGRTGLSGFKRTCHGSVPSTVCNPHSLPMARGYCVACCYNHCGRVLAMSLHNCR